MNKELWIEIGGVFYAKKPNRSGNHLVCTFVDGHRVVLPPIKELPKVSE